MSLLRLKIGELIPAVVQAFDGDTALFPQAIYTNEDTSTIIATNDMAHTVNGKYIDKSVAFPSSTLVSVVYKVYSDAAHTTLEPNHSDLLDLFLQADAVATPGSISIVERIEAKFLQARLTGLVTVPKLVGTVKSTRIKAQIVQAKITGQIKQQKIIGIIRECS